MYYQIKKYIYQHSCKGDSCLTTLSIIRNEKEKGWITYDVHSPKWVHFWGTDPVPLLGVIHTYFGPVVPTPILGLVLSTLILAWCYPHQFWSGAARAYSGRVQQAPIMLQCHQHQFWPGATHTKSGPMPPTPNLVQCHPRQCWLWYSLHLSLQSLVCT